MPRIKPKRQLPKSISSDRDTAPLTAIQRLSSKERIFALRADIAQRNRSSVLLTGKTVLLEQSQHEGILAHEVFSWEKTTNPFLRIVHLRDLEDNWDGYKATKFSENQVCRSLDLYSKISNYYIDNNIDFSCFKPFIAPCSDNAVLFEWAGNKFPTRELEVYIPPQANQLLSFLKTDHNFFEEEGEIDDIKIESLLDWLFER